ncbi:DNA starvation/stationary phase protection protein [uncultured Anaerococcus sp.]|uniref:Dps family protein n=1 Tax=uncultured Anaerococcus sp. TaxID=293428 RepID=UPI00288BE084|nr:DNA starvation/stationary phase protection protein [uncultured Anaerococcus sp.]
MIKELNKYLANLNVLNIKLHNLHWNIIGKQFVAVHEYFESEYDKAFERIDQIAEVIKMEGDYPIASLKEYLENASIKELDESKDIKIEESLEIFLNDIKNLRKDAYSIREKASEIDNFSVSNIMEEYIEDYNKQIWFIESMLK